MVQTATDLLDIGAMSRMKKRVKKLKLNLGVDVRKSVNKIFNNIGANVELVQKAYDIKTIGWNLGVLYLQGLNPLSFGENNRELFRIAGGINGNTKSYIFSKFYLGGGIRFLQSKYDLLPGNKLQNSENGLEIYALSDGRVGHGFSRMGIWFDAGIPHNNGNLKPYQRVASRLGYAITFGKDHNNVDLETTVNLGYIFGSAPIYNQFFAGNTTSNFLYTSLTSLSSQTMPDGPIVRSLGEKQGGIYTTLAELSGGTSYWGLNFNFSIPISGWARPLIPNIVIEEDLNLTLPDAIVSQGVTAKSFIANDLVQSSGLSDEEADIKAQAIVDKDINPTLRYLARRANVYSVKPIVFFDLAQMNRRNSGDETWGAAGAGLQLNIVNAKLDLGYMQTLFPSADKSKGNFLMRFTVQNFY
jgi:hypothetical protein